MAEVNYCLDRAGRHAREGEEEGGRNKPDYKRVIGAQKNQMRRTKLKINVCGFQYGRELSGRPCWHCIPVRTQRTGDALLLYPPPTFFCNQVNCGWTLSVTDMHWITQHFKKRKGKSGSSNMLTVTWTGDFWRLGVFSRIWLANDWEVIILGRCIMWL